MQTVARKGVTVNSMSSLSKGDVVELLSSGGGGFGNPKERAVEKVVQDVKDGLVSIESARRDYDVVVNPKTLGGRCNENRAIAG